MPVHEVFLYFGRAKDNFIGENGNLVFASPARPVDGGRGDGGVLGAQGEGDGG
jgi:hypothetical protein